MSLQPIIRGRLLPILITLTLLGGCSTLPSPLQPTSEDSTGDLGQESVGGAGDVYVKLSVEYMRRGELDTALKKIKRGIEVDPNNADAHNVIALIYDQLGETAAAESHFRRALTLQPRNSYYYNAYGAFLCKRDRYPEAERAFQQALSNPLYRTPEIALTNAGICAKKANNLAQAQEYLRRALQHNPKIGPALLNLAEISHVGGQLPAARKYLNRFHEVSQSTPQSLWLGIQIERQLGDKHALASYEMQLRGRFPDSEENHLLQESKHR